MSNSSVNSVTVKGDTKKKLMIPISILGIIGIIVIILIVIALFKNANKQKKISIDLIFSNNGIDIRENFASLDTTNAGFNLGSNLDSNVGSTFGSNLNTPPNLSDFYKNPSASLSGLSVDSVRCDPSCCSFNTTPTYDNLTSGEIATVLATRHEKSPYIKTDYTCANGAGGVGCPCVTKSTYNMIASRGQNTGDPSANLDPSLYVNADQSSFDPNYFENLSMLNRTWDINSKGSPYSPNRKFNDVHLQRLPFDISNIQSASQQ